ncbi:uncharacterized protein [Gossypium hirsutum]|uniref:FACT complex subunit n=1 Tax=Gossypium hirsutum TaxID=3635 RepID=A0A1U8KX27_GOSHI|nr:uncharacterized protein LOC107921657 [Gossypium hirsutum]
MVQLDELDELRAKADEKPRKHKEVTKQSHDVHVKRMNQFKILDKVLLDKLDPRMFPLELKLRGSNTFVVQNVFPYVTIEVTHSDYDTFKVNSLHLKLYFNGNTALTVSLKREVELRL